MTAAIDDPALTTVEAAAVLACNAETVRRAIKRGDLHAFQYGAVLRIRRSDLDAFIAAHTTGGDQLAPRRRRKRTA